MKKRIFLLLSALSLLGAMLLAVHAQNQAPTEAEIGAAAAKAAAEMVFPADKSDYVADCPACGEKQVTWKAVTTNGRVGYNVTGHFYCTGITKSTHTQFVALNNGGTVCLHLNGETLQNTGRIAALGGDSTINIMGSGTIVGNGTTDGDYKQGVLLIQEKSTVNLYGGTYRSALQDMAVVNVQHKESVLNMYPAAVIDSNVGHNVDVVNGTFNMYGGVIQNAVTAGSGGNVRLRSANGSFNMYGGEIRNGSSSAMNAGGNVYVTGGAKFNLYDGVIIDGQGTGMYSHGSDIYVYNGTLSMYGGSVDGQVAVAAGYAVYLDGAPVIKGSGLWLDNGAKVTWGQLKDGAAVTVCTEGAFTDANEKADDYASYFHTPSELSKIVLEDHKLCCVSDCTADSQAPLSDGKSLKILALTSSFGLNTTEFLYEIATAHGATDVVVGRLYASGCSLQKHVTWAKEGTAGYEYTKNSTGIWELQRNATFLDGLLDEDWDIIYMQQSGANSPAISTYKDYIDQFIEIINANKTNPDARFVWNMTWAYQGNSSQPVFVEDFKCDQMAMYRAILNAVRKKVQVRTDFTAIIPNGTAIQNARTSYFGDNLARDTYHLNNLGKVVAGYTAYAVLTDTPLTQINLDMISSEDSPEILILSDSDKQVILEAVNAAIQKPFEVTPSSYAVDPDPAAAHPEVIRGAEVNRAAQGMTFPKDKSDIVADCPACGEKQVTWKAVTGNGRVGYNTIGHFYCTEITQSAHTQFIGLDNGGTVCLHLNGETLRNAGRIAALGGNSTINIMGNGKIIGNGTADGDYKQGVLVSQNAATINLYGGIYMSGLANMPVVYITSGANPRINMYRDAVISSNVGHNVDITTGTFNMYGGTIQNAVATGRGGNVRLRSAVANFNMCAGTIYGGASSDAAAGGNVYLTGGASFKLSGGIVAGGKGVGSGSVGGNIYVNNGAFSMTGGHILQNNGLEKTEVYITENGTFQIGDALTVRGAFGGATTEADRIYINVNGKTMTVTGSGTLYAFDSANDSYQLTNGAAAVEQTVTVETDLTAPNGNRYIAIKDASGVYSFHRLQMPLTAVTLRPDAAGLYFKAKYECDQVLAPLVKNYGVVLSVNNMPGADFATEAGDINIATVGKEAFASGLETTSTSVFGILKDSRKAELNDRYGKMPIFANTYVELENGTVIMGENGTSQSLYQVLETIDANWADYEENQESILNFFRYWATRGISSWEFSNIK